MSTLGVSCTALNRHHSCVDHLSKATLEGENNPETTNLMSAVSLYGQDDTVLTLALLVTSKNPDRTMNELQPRVRLPAHSAQKFSVLAGLSDSARSVPGKTAMKSNLGSKDKE